MRCRFVTLTVLGFCLLTACGGASNGVFAPRVPATSVRPSSDVMLYDFGWIPDAMYPMAGLLAGRKGEYYGTSYNGGEVDCGTVYKVTAAGKEEVLYDFRCTPDGAFPQSTLIMDREGTLYGTTSNGGRGGTYYGNGTVFKITPTGGERVLYDFPDASNDGEFPLSGLVMTKSGALLGTTLAGGKAGDGVVFELTPSGSTYKENVIHAFTGDPDGAEPTEALVVDSRGNLYGTTPRGGNSVGTIFKLTPSGSRYAYSVIYRFKGNADGGVPYAGLLPGQNGVLYGLTTQGGTEQCGCGTVFELMRKGAHYRKKVLYSFRGGSDASDPFDKPGLVADQSGNLYGTTSAGGGASTCTNGCGTVFELARSGEGFTESVLYAFQGSQNGPDGAYPQGGVIVDRNGDLLGTTAEGGKDFGTVFSITP